MLAHQFKPLIIKGKALLPIVQGGMGVGVSAHRLAGAVASEGGVGTIASVDLRHHHPDLLAQSEATKDQATLDALNLTALDREIRMAKDTAQGRGMVAVNVMKAVDIHAQYVRQACESGADAIVMGAGLPLDLPEMTADHPNVALIPILSDSRGINVVLKRWMKKGKLPDAIVIEHPAHAGGHLGAATIEGVHDEKFEFERVLAETHELFAKLEIDPIPLIVAGGINSHAKVAHLLGCGANAVQLGTAFAVTEEGDAHINFKHVLAGAQKADVVEFMSVAGLPARAVKTPWLAKYLKMEAKAQANAKADPRRCTQSLNCLSVCGFRDGLAKIGQFCIDLKLAAAVRGEVNQGLFFRGSENLPFGSAIRPVRELMGYLLTGHKPLGLPA
ncbi:NAD(P)H-dependent flavin oxidoreductase [Jeongeupia chitinilytica]|uniref:2-nitropropane dioxygenase n=1 Tax=Jeongeupia chitinilytica TaxID=1041641 RepID=A0ABQ3H0F5_9NEIS|nr:nitronate monooxygenase family protein [Jeongeupia chitinilytica]GHD64175.1 2-nitropropane dioxygenase [Jeongeupia chitinilytica]